jgi:hypothetical protein
MIVKHRERERVVLKGIKLLCAFVLCVPGIRYGWTAAACCRKSILCHVAGGETAKKIKQKGYAVSTSFLCELAATIAKITLAKVALKDTNEALQQIQCP